MDHFPYVATMYPQNFYDPTQGMASRSCAFHSPHGVCSVLLSELLCLDIYRIIAYTILLGQVAPMFCLFKEPVTPQIEVNS